MTEVVLSANALLGPAFLVARLPSAAASTNATLVRTGNGRVYRVFGLNATAAAKFLKLYNKATAPTVGTDTPVLTIPIPASGAFSFEISSVGLQFPLGIGYAITGLAPDADTTVLVAGDVLGVNIVYL